MKRTKKLIQFQILGVWDHPFTLTHPSCLVVGVAPAILCPSARKRSEISFDVSIQRPLVPRHHPPPKRALHLGPFC